MQMHWLSLQTDFACANCKQKLLAYFILDGQRDFFRKAIADPLRASERAVNEILLALVNLQISWLRKAIVA